MGSSDFQDRVRQALLLIPAGQFTTYKELARALNSSPRAVGQALKRNPTPVVVPCHRVVAADFSLGGYCGEMDSSKKIKLLEQEGLVIANGKIQNTDKMFIFPSIK